MADDSKSNSHRVLDQLGPYLKHPPVSAFCEISARSYLAYHEILSTNERSDLSLEHHAVIRMMYLAEATSTALRLNATWALSTPAMSLARDRYEQVVRFSWLARQDDKVEWAKFVGSHFSKGKKLYRLMTEQQRNEYVKIVGKLPEWMTVASTKEERDFLGRWQATSLDVLARKRDEMPGYGNLELDKATLADLYISMYAEFSSLTHYDCYALRFLEVRRVSSDRTVLSPDPRWPALLCMHNALFDVIQCYEAAAAYFENPSLGVFHSCYAEWCECMRKIGIWEAKQDKSGPIR